MSNLLQLKKTILALLTKKMLVQRCIHCRIQKGRKKPTDAARYFQNIPKCHCWWIMQHRIISMPNFKLFSRTIILFLRLIQAACDFSKHQSPSMEDSSELLPSMMEETLTWDLDHDVKLSVSKCICRSICKWRKPVERPPKPSLTTGFSTLPCNYTAIKTGTIVFDWSTHAKQGKKTPGHSKFSHAESWFQSIDVSGHVPTPKQTSIPTSAFGNKFDESWSGR